MQRTILCIEDHEDTALIIKTMLCDAGFQVDVAKSGEVGIAKAKEKQYDLILLDILLPKMSGWDVFRTLRNELDYRPKYIFLSAIPVSEQKFKTLKEAGVSFYIDKPFKEATLINSVSEALEEKSVKPIKIETKIKRKIRKEYVEKKLKQLKKEKPRVDQNFRFFGDLKENLQKLSKLPAFVLWKFNCKCAALSILTFNFN